MTNEIREPNEVPPRAKRLIIGDPLTSEKMDEQLLPKRRALLMILLIGGTAMLAFSPWVALAVVVVLLVVVTSYRQLVKAYPSGGGDYEVARTNLGEVPLAQQLMLVHGLSITLVPWLLDSSELIYGRRSRVLPGDERAGRPAPSVPTPPRHPGTARSL